MERSGDLEDASRAREEAVRRGLRDIWTRTRDLVFASVAVLERASINANSGTLTASERDTAHREAHKLVSSLGMFGMADGSAAARNLEQLLASEAPDPQTMDTLVVEIRQVLERHDQQS